MPAMLPLFDRMVASSRGGVFLREFVIPGDTSARWQELGEDLVPRAAFHTSPDFRLLAADHRTLLGVEVTQDAAEILWAPFKRR